MMAIGKIRAVQAFFCIMVLVFSRGRAVETSTNIDEKLSRIGERVKRVDTLLSHMVPMMKTIANPKTFADDCTVEFAAYGLDDPNRLGYINTTGGSSEEIFVPQKPYNQNRGVTLVELDPTTCRTRNRQRFDTWTAAENSIQVVETIDSAAMGTIIVGVTADTAEGMGTTFQNTAGPIFTRYNMNIRGLNLRAKFAFIMQKGYPKKTVFESKPRYEESVQIKVQLRGSSASEVSFVRLQ